MPSKNWIKIVIGLFSAIIFGTSLLLGESIDESGLKWISATSSAVIMIVMIFDRWAWRWPLIKKVSEVSGRPVAHGTWKGVIEYERDGDGKPGTTECYFSIYQTYSSVEVRGFFTTSSSYSMTANIDHPLSSQTRLIFAYRSEAPHGKRITNRPNDGTAILDIIGLPIEAITGSYYTDRGGAGTIKLEQYNKKVAESFAQAAKLTYTRR